MEYLLDFKNDQNNGLSLIASFSYYSCSKWGLLSASSNYAAIPGVLVADDTWSVFTYRYESGINEWVFNQVITTEFQMGETLVQTDVSNTHLTVLNPVTRLLYIYDLDNSGKWLLHQTITIPHNPIINNYSTSISAYTGIIVVGDYDYIQGANTGAVFIYTLNSNTNLYDLSQTINNPSIDVNKFGAAVSAHSNGFLFIGTPNNQTASANDGLVYIYKFAVTWVFHQSFIGENQINGYFGAALDIHDSVAVISAPGLNGDTGKAYFYELVAGNWVHTTDVTAPPPGGNIGDEFGTAVSVVGTQAAVTAGNEAGGQGAIYLYDYIGAVWVFNSRFTLAGAQGYGNSMHIVPNVVFSTITSGNIIRLSYSGAAWSSTVLITKNNIYLKNTVGGGSYNISSQSTYLEFALATPISGNYRVILRLKDALQVIGDQNNTVYFYENGIYKNAKILNKDYNEADLAIAVENAMNAAGTNTYAITYDGVSNKYTIQSSGLFAFGSNVASSEKNSLQDKVMGFLNNNLSLVSDFYVSDREADLATATQIGVLIREAIAQKPVRNNNFFAEIGLLAELDTSDHYFKINKLDDQFIKIPQKTSTLTFSFPYLSGGAPININTNDLFVRLVSV